MDNVSELDLFALIRTWEGNPNLLNFRDATLSCFRELQALRRENENLKDQMRGVAKQLDAMAGPKEVSSAGRAA